MKPNIVFWHSKSCFDIQTEAEYRILTFLILFWHSNWGRISLFGNRNPILTLKLRPNIILWHSTSYFDIRIEDVYRILTFKMLFWHSNWGGISYFNLQNSILTFKLKHNIEFRHSTLDLRQNISFWHLKSYFNILRPNIVFWQSKSWFDIRTEAEYYILTFKIICWHSNRSLMSYIDIRNPIFIFEMMVNIVFWYSKSYFNIKLSPNIVLWHSKSYSDIRNEAELHILTF